MTKKIKVTYPAILCHNASLEIKDGDVIFAGIGWPCIFIGLALAFHAPHAQVIMEGGLCTNEEFLRPADDIADSNCSTKNTFFSDFVDVFQCILARGYVDVGFLGAGQIDKYGNIDTTVIGDYYHPTRRLPGSGGGFDIGSYSKRVILTAVAGQFVEKLDYCTTPGYLNGYESRYEAGLPEDTGPAMVGNLKGIFRFDKVTKEMYLESYFPGVTIEDIKKDVPWDLKVSPDVRQAPLPSEEHMNFMMNFDPAIILGRTWATNVQITNLKKMAEARKK